MRFVNFLFLVFFLMIFSCTKDKVDDNVNLVCADVVSFGQEIEPLMNQHCIGCHNSSSASGGYNLEGHTNISNQADQIIGVMQASGFQLMPIGGPALNDDLIQRFLCWIEQGKLNN